MSDREQQRHEVLQRIDRVKQRVEAQRREHEAAHAAHGYAPGSAEDVLRPLFCTLSHYLAEFGADGLLPPAEKLRSLDESINEKIANYMDDQEFDPELVALADAAVRHGAEVDAVAQRDEQTTGAVKGKPTP